MKINCIFCEKLLEKPIEMFGPESTPVCQECYLLGKLEDLENQEEIKVLQKEIKEIEDEIADLQDEIYDRECEIDSLEDDVQEKRDSINSILEHRKQVEKNKMTLWLSPPHTEPKLLKEGAL
jgi:chromosome segregation ATPase